MRSEPLMSTQLHTSSPTSNDELDRTDELPQLDVEAYEASLAENQKGLSRTDTWTVEALRDVDELADSANRNVRIPVLDPVRDAGRLSNDAEALTVNVERILKRIAEVEADVVAAHEANAALQKRADAIQADREQQALRIKALEAENARLGEHRSLADEMVQRLERQLREQAQHSDAQLMEAHTARLAERSQADQRREQLEQQISQLTEQGTTLHKDHRGLQERLQASVALATQRAEMLAGLERTLGDEKTNAARLARQLASKLRDCEVLGSLVEQRNGAIDELTDTRDDLSVRLQKETTAGVELKAQLAAAGQAAQAHRATMVERDHAIDGKDRQLAELIANLDRTGDKLELVQQQHDAATRRLAALDAAHSRSLSELAGRVEEIGTLQASLEASQLQVMETQSELSAAALSATDSEQRLLALEIQYQQAQQTIADLGSQRDAAETQLRSLSAERDALLPASGQLGALVAEIGQKDIELTRLQDELAVAHTEIESSTQLADERTEELTRMRAKLSEHGVALRTLEQTIRARDELVEGLMAQLQTSRDERSIISGQLEKSRARVKSMTQQIFGRDSQIAELQADLAVHTEALAAIRRDVNRIGEGAEGLEDIERVLEPVEHDGEAIVLNGKAFTVGRTAENDISIPSRLVSRHHARLLVGPTGVIVEDAGSTNGCFVNGEQVRQHLMRDGDVLELGDLRYRLCIRSTRDTRARVVVPIFENRRSDE